MPPVKSNNRMEVDSDSDISIDLEHTNTKAKAKAKPKAGDKRKVDKGKGKAKDTVRGCINCLYERRLCIVRFSKRIHGKHRSRVLGRQSRKTRQAVCRRR